MEAVEVIRLINTGDLEKIVRYLYKSKKKISSYIKKNSGSSEDVDDVFQEALIVFCEKVNHPDFSFSSKPETFLYGITQNLWRNELKKRNKTIPAFSVSESLEEEGFSLAEDVFKKLSDNCKSLLTDFYLKGLSMVEIAKKRAVSSPKIVKDRKYKCLSKARKMYQISHSNLS